MSEMDKIFRNKMDGHTTPLPDDMWSKIDSGLRGKKKRRGLFFILFLGLTAISAAAFAFYDNSEIVDEGIIAENAQMTTDETSIVSPLSSQKQQIGENKQSLSSVDDGSQTNIDLKTLNTKNRVIHIPTSEKSIEKEVIQLEIEESKNIQSSSEKLIIIEGEEEGRTVLEINSIANIYPNLSEAIFTINDRNFPDPIGCPTFSKRNTQNFFVEAYYKPLLAYSQLGSNSAEVGESYLDLRRNSEQGLYSWAAGAYVGWISNYNVGLKAGIEYEVINERFNYEDPEAIRNQTVITIDTMFNPDGSFSVSSDTSVVQVSGTEIQNIYNYHKTLSIPIHALYQMNFKNFALELSGGPIFNINYSNRGKIVDPSNEDQWFTKGDSGAYDVFKDRLSVSFSLSISAMYSLNEKVQLFLRPEFKYHPNSISKTSSPFTQKYLNSGLSLGARYYLSGNPNY